MHGAEFDPTGACDGISHTDPSVVLGSPTVFFRQGSMSETFQYFNFDVFLPPVPCSKWFPRIPLHRTVLFVATTLGLLFCTAIGESIFTNMTDERAQSKCPGGRPGPVLVCNGF